MRIAPPDVLAARLSAARASLEARTLDALLVTSLPNIAYLSGFFASAAAAIVFRDHILLIGDSRYREALAARAAECSFIRIVELGTSVGYDQSIADHLLPLSGARVGIEASYLTLSRHRYLLRTLGTTWESTLVETDGIVEKLRLRKDAWEISCLREGARRLSSLAKCILSNALAGRSEADVAAEIDAGLRREGFERPAFDTIVASGPNAALPHGRAGQRQIEKGDLVVIDFGGVLDGYCTDLTRTVVVGPASERQLQVIEQVAESQEAAFVAVRPGGAPEAVDEAARDTLTRHGIGEAFTHGTGHGLGLEVHEAPRVTRARPHHPEPPLADGMVMTLEPGAYFPGWGGVRIEDDVLVTKEGAEWLTDVPRVL